MPPLRSILLLAVLVPLGVSAQPADPLGGNARVYAAVAAGPGLGGMVGGARPLAGVFTGEAALYADYTPRVAGGAGRLLTSVGVGGAVRLARVAALVGNREPGRIDLDAGVRLGPSFYTAFFEQTAASEARAFRVMTDAFARGTVRLGSGRVAFAEIGTQAPAIRAGLSASLGPPAVR